MKKRSNETLEAIASSFREEFGISDLRCPDVDTLIVNVAHKYGITLVRCFDDEMPGEEASADTISKKIYYRETLRGRLKEGDKRARFIFMEEIGHILLGHTGIRHRSTQQKIHEKTVPLVRIEEAEARYFAVAALAPLDKIESFWDAITISNNFQISMQAAEFRKEEFDKQKRLKAGGLRQLPDCVTDFLKEARARGYPVKTVID